jgi:hypothetical protein
MLLLLKDLQPSPADQDLARRDLGATHHQILTHSLDLDLQNAQLFDPLWCTGIRH